MVVVKGRWSEPKSSPTVHSVPVDHPLLTAVMSGVLRPIYGHCCAVDEDAGILGEKSVFYQFAALVCRLVLFPQWGMGVEVASG